MITKPGVTLFGFSYRNAPAWLLDRLSADESAQVDITERILRSPAVTEVMVLSTCNRVEVYTGGGNSSGHLSAIHSVLSNHSGIPINQLSEYAYTRHGAAASGHLFRVAGGLDSAVIGDRHVLGQVRRAYATAKANHSVGPVLHNLVQRVLSAGKRVQSETAFGTTQASVVSAALGIAGRLLGQQGTHSGLKGKAAVVIGAGSIGSLAATQLASAGVAHVHVVNRSLRRAQHIVHKIGESPQQRWASSSCPRHWQTPMWWSVAQQLRGPSSPRMTSATRRPNN